MTMTRLLLALSLTCMTCVGVASADPSYLVDATEPVLIAQADAGGEAAPAPAATATPAALPDPAESPQASASLLYRLYKAGHLIPMVVVASFFLLTLLQKWVAWLRTGYRKLLVASALAGLGMLAERAGEGTTPNLTMIMGAVGVAFAMWMKAQGEPAES
jgi:hypothetical protein